jgi:hypothetical protein
LTLGDIVTVQSVTLCVYPLVTITQQDLYKFPGETVSIIPFSQTSSIAGTTFTWTNDNTEIGLAASGTGDIEDWEAPVNSTGLNYLGIITIIGTTPDGCTQTFTDAVTIYPLPLIMPTATITGCPGETLTLSNVPNIPALVFSWTNTNIAIGLAASGTGIPTWIAPVNNTGINIIGTITLTATLNGDPYPITGGAYNVTIYPTPQITSDLSDINMTCGDLLSYVPTSDVANASFEWTRAVVTCCTNAAASGTSNILEVLNCNPQNNGDCTVTYFIRACGQSGCCGEWVELHVILSKGQQN